MLDSSGSERGMKMGKNKPRKIGTAKQKKDRKAIRGQLNELTLANIKLRDENARLQQRISTLEQLLTTPEKSEYDQLQAKVEQLEEWIDYFGMAAKLEGDDIRARQVEAIKRGEKLPVKM
jgi:BMFP domain-containing protein YqiC